MAIRYEQVDPIIAEPDDPYSLDWLTLNVAPARVVQILAHHGIDPGNYIAQMQDIASSSAGSSITRLAANLDTYVGTPLAWEEIIVPAVEEYQELPTVAQIAVKAAVSYFTGGSASAAFSEVAAETAAEEVAEASVWDTISSWASDAWGEVTGWFDGGEDLAGAAWDEAGFGDLGELGDIATEATSAWSEVAGVASDVLSSFGSGGSSSSSSRSSGAMVRTGGMTMNGDGWEEGGMVQTGGGAVVAGGIWLGSLLARAFGGAARGAVFTAANGVRVRMGQLWPLVRKYGSQAVAGALGVTVGGLGTMLMTPEAMSGRSGRGRGRGRGISARDVKTTRRTLRSIKKLWRMMPTRPSSSSSGHHHHYRRRSYGRR